MSTSRQLPSRAPYAVTPHATNPLPIPSKALYIGGTGNVVLRGVGSDADVTFTAVPSGTTLHVAAAYVRATSTATNIVALA